MEEALNRLRGIGIEQISKATKLATSKIEDVLEKRFDRLDRTRARGFVHILEREYKVDLSEWLEEYDRFYSPSTLEDKSSSLKTENIAKMHEWSKDSQSTSSESNLPKNLQVEKDGEHKRESEKENLIKIGRAHV